MGHFGARLHTFYHKKSRNAALMLRLIAAGDKVFGFRSDCFLLDMGNPADYARASEAFEANRPAFLRDEAVDGSAG